MLGVSSVHKYSQRSENKIQLRPKAEPLAFSLTTCRTTPPRRSPASAGASRALPLPCGQLMGRRRLHTPPSEEQAPFVTTSIPFTHRHLGAQVQNRSTHTFRTEVAWCEVWVFFLSSLRRFSVGLPKKTRLYLVDSGYMRALFPSFVVIVKASGQYTANHTKVTHSQPITKNVHP